MAHKGDIYFSPVEDIKYKKVIVDRIQAEDGSIYKPYTKNGKLYVPCVELKDRKIVFFEVDGKIIKECIKYNSRTTKNRKTKS